MTNLVSIFWAGVFSTNRIVWHENLTLVCVRNLVITEALWFVKLLLVLNGYITKLSKVFI